MMCVYVCVYISLLSQHIYEVYVIAIVILFLQIKMLN